jgi:cytochrome oxidase Cu insertion factor (SCO1/SenC/PrrC family)
VQATQEVRLTAANKPATTPHRSEITLIRERGKFLGYVEAPDEASTIAEAIKQFEITNPEQHRRLIPALDHGD